MVLTVKVCAYGGGSVIKAERALRRAFAIWVGRGVPDPPSSALIQFAPHFFRQGIFRATLPFGGGLHPIAKAPRMAYCSPSARANPSPSTTTTSCISYSHPFSPVPSGSAAAPSASSSSSLLSSFWCAAKRGNVGWGALRANAFTLRRRLDRSPPGARYWPAYVRRSHPCCNAFSGARRACAGDDGCPRRLVQTPWFCLFLV